MDIFLSETPVNHPNTILFHSSVVFVLIDPRELRDAIVILFCLITILLLYLLINLLMERILYRVFSFTFLQKVQEFPLNQLTLS